MVNELGIYEKALPKGDLEQKLKVASELGFAFMELSIDETDERIQRLMWTDEQINQLMEWTKKYGVKIRSICFSAQRRFPMGSHNSTIRDQSLTMLKQAIVLAAKLNVRVIQLAGYDVYYEKKDATTRSWFIKNLNLGLAYATQYGVMLSIEIMDDPFINSITKYLGIYQACASPWLSVYPDIGNLTAWNQDKVWKELELGYAHIVALHLKDTLPVTPNHAGKFKNVEFGTGCVDFKALFRFLIAKQFRGPLMIEAWYEDQPNTLELLKGAITFIKTQEEEATHLC